MSSASEQHADDPPSTSHDTVGKKKSRVKFPCMLCKGSHLTHLCPHMDKASKLLEDMTVSQPQLPASYRKISLNPPVVDGMINPVPPSVNPIGHVVNLVTSLIAPVDKVVDPIPSSVNPPLPLESFIDPGGYRGPPTFSKWLKIVFWPFWQFTIFSRFSLSGSF